jgi:tripartite-type tricarboxylate transporter receptor subunit TctC
VLSVRCRRAGDLGPRIDRARQNQPGKLVLSTSGGCAQFSAELFHHMSGMKLIVVVYKGFPALLDAMAGQAQINIGSLIQTLPHMNGGKIKSLATTGSRRSAAGRPADYCRGGCAGL